MLLKKELRVVSVKAFTLLLAVWVLCLLVAPLSHAIEICDAYGCTIYAPQSPGKPHTNRGMRATVTPHRGAGDAEFHGRASGFKPGEFVTVWEYRPDGRVAFMPSGGKASGSGSYAASVKTFAGIDPGGVWHLCFKGLRTGRVACAAFKLKAVPWGSVPFNGPGGGTTTGSGGTTTGSGGTTTGSGGTTTGSGSGTSGCQAWNVSGSWQWVSDGFGVGPGSGPATLSQSGSSVSGTINDGSSSGNWALTGSISGSTLSLSLSPPPGYAGPFNFSGTVSSTKISGSGYGDFTNGTATCVS